MTRLLRLDTVKIILGFLLATAIFYGYYWFFVPGKLQYLYQNWDGPNYLLIAQTFYDPQKLSQLNTFGNSPEYFACHFPLYPIFVALFSFIGDFRSLLFVSLIFSLAFILAFYRLLVVSKITPHPLWLTLPLIVFPSRWFIVSHVGSSEPVFLFFLVLFMIFFIQKKYWLSAAFAALAQLARPQGILIGVGLAAFLLFELSRRRLTLKQAISTYYPYLLIPIALISVFTLYLIQYQDFFAFFHSISTFRHLQFPPFHIFSQIHVVTSINIWKEFFIYLYLIFFLGVYRLFQKKLYFFAFLALAYFLPLPFLVHADISRYSLPLIPFCYIAFSELITSKPFRFGLLLLLPAIFLQSLSFTLLNLSP